ncbi:MAG: site-specific integrase [Planctomycetota bacterium]|nr:MAG: site-specific integrase [Planctomycetota bacterium]REJ90355.1 MAG: site-specific integrase [Planctomycetota bacterium]
MHDVEAFNRKLVLDGGSDSFVTKRMALVKALIDRAGRPEFEHQSLPWNWESRDKIAGKLAVSRKLPTLRQLKRILRASKERERAMVWMGIGLGFGQSDISQTCVGQINKKTYDLRRGKTNVERYGETPPMVWKAIQDYLKDTPRPRGELLFVTRRGHPLVHGKKSDAIKLWWRRLRKDLGYGPKTLDGFYVLRHLGATEYGSRGTNSINDVRRWLGHAASSQVADIYMRPVAAEHEELITWVRNALLTGKADLKLR